MYEATLVERDYIEYLAEKRGLKLIKAYGALVQKHLDKSSAMYFVCVKNPECACGVDCKALTTPAFWSNILSNLPLWLTIHFFAATRPLRLVRNAFTKTKEVYRTAHFEISTSRILIVTVRETPQVLEILVHQLKKHKEDEEELNTYIT